MLDDSGECDGSDGDNDNVFFSETVPLPAARGELPTSDNHPEYGQSVTLVHMSRTITDADARRTSVSST